MTTDEPSRSLLTATNLHRVVTVIVSLVVAWDHYRHPETPAPAPVVAHENLELAKITEQRRLVEVELEELKLTKAALVNLRESIVDKLLTKHP